MKKAFLIFLLIVCAINSYAYDFSAVCSTGQTLYYNLTSDSTVVVTYPGNLGVVRVNIYDGSFQYNCHCLIEWFC